MTIRRAVRRPVKSQAPKPEPADVRVKKAHRLPMPGPGIVVPVPLALLPEYLELYHLTPMTRGEVIDRETASKTRKPAGFLYVKRTTKGNNQ
jgi:hypothetical protein